MSESERRNGNGAEEPAFKVNDRRRVGRDEPAAPEAGAPAESTQAEATGTTGADDAASRTPPPVDFSTFILSFASTALIQLGAAPHPETGEVRATPELARGTIDLLGMLREKTRGNLTDEETKLFDALLYDLRMRYVEVTRSK